MCPPLSQVGPSFPLTSLRLEPRCPVPPSAVRTLTHDQRRLGQKGEMAQPGTVLRVTVMLEELNETCYDSYTYLSIHQIDMRESARRLIEGG
jgi:hypothetical protein